MAKTLVSAKCGEHQLDKVYQVTRWLINHSVLTGLSRLSKSGRGNVPQVNVLLFAWAPATVQEDEYDMGPYSDHGGFASWDFQKSITEHVNHQQSSLYHTFRRNVIKFQFSWYELISRGEGEKRRYSGMLYKDDLKRSLQLQSFMVSSFQHVE